MSQTVLDSKTLVGTDVDDGIGTLQINGMLFTKTPPLDDVSTKIATFEFMQGQGTGITISTSEPINPDLAPENKKWIQIDDNKMIVNIFEWDSNISQWPLFYKVVKIYNSVSGYNNVIELDNGTVWSHLSSGFSNFEIVSVPVKLDITDIKDAYAANDNIIIVKLDGTVWTKGYNHMGQLGLGLPSGNFDTYNPYPDFMQLPDSFNNPLKIIVRNNASIIQKSDGTVWGAGIDIMNGLEYQTNTYTQLSSTFNNCKDIVFGTFHLAILTASNQLYVQGYNSSGALGTGNYNTLYTLTFNNISNISKIWAGGSVTIIQKSDGTVWGAGANGNQQLSILGGGSHPTFVQFPTFYNNPLSVFISDYAVIIQTSNGEYWGGGSFSWGGPGGYTQVSYISNTVDTFSMNQNYFLGISNGYLIDLDLDYITGNSRTKVINL